MKQCETISTPLNYGAAVLKELSFDPAVKTPHLTILTPYVSEDTFTSARPAASVMMNADETKKLYEFLHRYFSDLPSDLNV